MKGKSWLKYLGYAVLLFAVMYLKDYVDKRFQTKMSDEFKIDVVLIAIGILINIGIGALLGVEHLLSEIRKTGKWKINAPKFILIGIPMLIATLTIFGFYLKNPFINKLLQIIPYPIWFFLLSNSQFMVLFQVILGYIVITSFYKYNKNTEII